MELVGQLRETDAYLDLSLKLLQANNPSGRKDTWTRANIIWNLWGWMDTGIHCSLIPALVLWASCMIRGCPLPWWCPALRELSEKPAGTFGGSWRSNELVLSHACQWHCTWSSTTFSPCTDQQGLKKLSLLLYFCLPNVTQNISCGTS